MSEHEGAYCRPSVPVSVIITTFNDGEWLERSIDSVLSQTQPPKEVIVVDDGSKDDVAEKVVKTKVGYQESSIIFIKN